MFLLADSNFYYLSFFMNTCLVVADGACGYQRAQGLRARGERTRYQVEPVQRPRHRVRLRGQHGEWSA